MVHGIEVRQDLGTNRRHRENAGTSRGFVSQCERVHW